VACYHKIGNQSEYLQVAELLLAQIQQMSLLRVRLN
jgi:hypothetical protein